MISSLEQLEFWPIPFYHWDMGLIRHNSRLTGGWLRSASMERKVPGLEWVTTPYSAGHKDVEKEAYWEKIRLDLFPGKPSRDGAFFVFGTREDADRARKRWFPDTARQLLEIRIPKVTNLHVADTAHLDSLPENWEAAARRYWAGELSEDLDASIPEIIVDGIFFVPQQITAAENYDS